MKKVEQKKGRTKINKQKQEEEEVERKLGRKKRFDCKW